MEEKYRTSPVIEMRRQRVGELKLQYGSVDAIHKIINQEAPLKGWGPTARWTIYRDLEVFFKKAVEESPMDAEGLRQAHIAQLEDNIMRMSLMINDKDKQNSWKAFEKADAIHKRHEMLMELGKFHNWNQGEINTKSLTLIDQSTNNYINQHDIVDKQLREAAPGALNTFMDQLEAIEVYQTSVRTGERSPIEVIAEPVKPQEVVVPLEVKPEITPEERVEFEGEPPALVVEEVIPPPLPPRKITPEL